MSDSTVTLDLVDPALAQHEVPVNNFMLSASNAALFARRAKTSAALTWGYIGGRFNGSLVAEGTVALTASNTNYIVAHRTTLVVSVSTSNTNWNDTTTYGRLYLVVAGSATVTSYEDHRAGSGGIFDTAAAGGPPSGSAGGDLTGTYPNPTVGANKVGVGKMAATQTDVFFGRDTAGAGAGEEITVAAAKTLLGLTGTNSGDQTITLTGDVTGTGTGSFATTIANNAVTNAKAAQMAAHTIKGNNTGSTANAIDLTLAQVAAEIGSLSALVVQSPAYATPLTIDLTGISAAIVVVNVGTLTGNITFDITNGTDGQVIRVRFTQDGTGSRIFTAGSNLRFSTDTPSPTLTTTASKMDRLAFEWHAGAGKADLIAVNKGY